MALRSRLSVPGLASGGLTYIGGNSPLGNGQGTVGTTSPFKATLTRIKVATTAAAASNPVDFPDMASPPTLSQSNTHDATLTVQANPSANPTVFRNSPGNRYIFDAVTGLMMGTSNQSPATATNLSSFAGSTTPVLAAGDEQNCYTVDFYVTNATVVELDVRRFVPDTVPYRIIIGNSFLARNGFIGSAGEFAKLTFASAFTGQITVECQFSGSLFSGVSVSAGGTITAPPGATYNMLALGDSITEGASSGDATFYAYDRWASTAAKQLGFLVRNAGVGQTGYSNPGPTHSKLVDQLPYLWADSTAHDIVAIANGVNDFNNGYSNATIAADALAAWQAIRAHQPQALIVVVGIWGCAFGPSAQLIATENALKAQFDAWADPCSVFLRNSTDPAGSWFTGTGYVGGPTGSGNSDTYTSADGLHPSRAGAIYSGGKVNTALRAALPALYTTFGVS